MKKVIVTLLAKKPDEIGRFLNKYYEKEIINEEGAFSWSCFFNTPSETLDILSTLIDNSEKYQIETLLVIGNVAPLKITENNLEDIIKLFVWI